MMLAIRLAGFEIRDSLGFAYSPASLMAWVHGQGFPKGLNISKALDAAAGAQRPVVGQADRKTSLGSNGRFNPGQQGFTPQVTAPATSHAADWDGWNTTLKPAWEPIVLAMKPLDGSYADNARRWGVAGLWVDGGRLPLNQPDRAELESKAHKDAHGGDIGNYSGGFRRQQDDIPPGRWPANDILDGSEEVEAQFPETTGRGARPARRNQSHWGNGSGTQDDARLPYDGGSAARFFYSAKATQGERDAGTYGLFWRRAQGTSDWERIDGHTYDILKGSNDRAVEAGLSAPYRVAQGNVHPTVKPLALCRHLARLTRPPTGGSDIDPFCGSGSIPIAAMMEGWDTVIGIEADTDYLEIARRRLAYWRAEMANEQAVIPERAR